eukprot:scaffold415645_cov35-Prasinocladus_malaysianus.AAC.1
MPHQAKVMSDDEMVAQRVSAGCERRRAAGNHHTSGPHNADAKADDVAGFVSNHMADIECVMTTCIKLLPYHTIDTPRCAL